MCACTRVSERVATHQALMDHRRLRRGEPPLRPRRRARVAKEKPSQGELNAAKLNVEAPALASWKGSACFASARPACNDQSRRAR
jgi:hypothetical protein